VRARCGTCLGISSRHCSARCGGARTASRQSRHDRGARGRLGAPRPSCQSDVVGDQEPDGLLAQRHQERHELVRTRLDRDPGEAPERSRALAHREAQCLMEQPRGAWSPRSATVGGAKLAGATSWPSKARSMLRSRRRSRRAGGGRGPRRRTRGARPTRGRAPDEGARREPPACGRMVTRAASRRRWGTSRRPSAKLPRPSRT